MARKMGAGVKSWRLRLSRFGTRRNPLNTGHLITTPDLPRLFFGTSNHFEHACLRLSSRPSPASLKAGALWLLFSSPSCKTFFFEGGGTRGGRECCGRRTCLSHARGWEGLAPSPPGLAEDAKVLVSLTARDTASPAPENSQPGA